MANKTQRLQKYLAHQGVGSRREIEKMIAAGKIAVNGQVVTLQGQKVDPTQDTVSVDGNVIHETNPLVYYFIHKPKGFVSSRIAQGGESRVIDLVPSKPRVYPVGRLDKDSQGLMLLTNDGLLTHRLTHPKFHISKTYEVMVYGNVSNKQLKRLREGIDLEEGRTLPAKVRIIPPPTGFPTPLKATWLEFILYEGKHRQIRRMAKAVKLSVLILFRTRFGAIDLAKLPEGSYRIAAPEEVQYLKKAVHLE